MVGSSVYRNHVSLNTDDTGYQTDFQLFLIQYRTLLDVRFYKVTDGTLFPSGIAYFCRIQAVFLHRFCNGDSACILELLGI